MGRARGVFDVITAIGVVAAITMLVRPGSKGPALVKALGDAFAMAAQGTIGATLTGQQPLPPDAPKSSGRGSGSSGGSSSDGGGSILPNPTDLIPGVGPFLPGGSYSPF